MKNVRSQNNKQLKFVHDVTKLMKDADCFVPFFIAGGSVYSTSFSAETEEEYEVSVPLFKSSQSSYWGELTESFLNDNGTNRNDYDIDVFFYNLEDAKYAVKKLNDFYTDKSSVVELGDGVSKHDNVTTYITQNALTVTHETYIRNDSNGCISMNPTIMYQFILRSYGDVYDVLNRFDINCSKCAVDHNGYFHATDDWSNEIKVDYEFVKYNTIARFFKYVKGKGAVDQDNLELKKLIDFIFTNPDKKIESYYEDTNSSLIKSLRSLKNSQYINQQKSTELIHELVIKYFKDAERITRFEEIDYIKYNPGSIKNHSLEYIIFYQQAVINDKVKSQSIFNNWVGGSLNSAKAKYPEYFI